MKRKIALVVVLIFSLITVTFSGCSDTSYIATVNGEKIPTEDYTLILMQYKAYAQQNLATLTSSDTATLADLWEMDYTEGNKFGDMFNQNAISMCITNYVIQQKFNELKLTLTDEDKASSDAQMKSDYESAGGEQAFKDYLIENGTSIDAYKRSLDQALYYNKLTQYIYGKDGEKEISEDAIKEYFSQNYVRIKHVLLKTSNDEGVLYTEEKIKSIEEKANAILARAQAGEDFDQLSTDESEDPGSTSSQYPYGYIFTKDGGMIEEFETAAFDMKVGEFRLIQTSYGFHVMKKYDLFDDPKIYEGYRSTLFSALTVDDFYATTTEWENASTIVKNDKALKKITIQNMK
ncbi:MAG: peptidylprolyl isomerase [Candidatus Pacebacteria bacterium]|nr:peptidylprolyl isomerase [Candidatus Paceibacterota bacterium]